MVQIISDILKSKTRENKENISYERLVQKQEKIEWTLNCKL